MPAKVYAKCKRHCKQRQIFTHLLFGASIILLPGLTAIPSISFAETLQIPDTPKSFSITLPGRGMSMTEVLEMFGEPQTKDPEVGEPPITRWNYKNYVVVFEYQYVIHSLSSNKPIGLKQPEPNETESHGGNEPDHSAADHNDSEHNDSGQSHSGQDKQNRNGANPSAVKMDGHTGHANH